MRINKAFIHDTFYVFAFLCVLFIPFPFHLLPFQVTDLIFGKLIRLLAGMMPGITIINPAVSSDSTSMYLLFMILFILAILIAFSLTYIGVWRQNRDRILPLLSRFLTYYLALQLIKYGFDKILKKQFYLPEPNILYTPFGQLDKDILFWSTMGTSYLYSLFTGLAEVFAGICLLFRKTRVVGLILSVFLFMHVLLINLSFDISVKLFSMFLLFLSVTLIAPQLRRLYSFLILRDINTLKREAETFPVFYHVLLRVSLKTFIIGLMFLEALYPAFSSRNMNDDLAKRPYLHGAYEVCGSDNSMINANLSKAMFKRFFIHRDGYFIFQDQRDGMYDFKLAIDTINHLFKLTGYDNEKYKISYHLNAEDSTIDLDYFFGQPYSLKAKAVNLKELPALRPQFHWTVDGVGEKGTGVRD
jgi:hypothetical protein